MEQELNIKLYKKNEIHYTTSDGEKLVFDNPTDLFGANLISSTYEEGKGILTFDDDITSIGNYAFYNCSGLTSVTMPNSVTSIGNGAFLGCSDLTSIAIPNSVTSIGSGAFYGTAWYNNQPDGVVYAGKVLYEYKGTMPENTEIKVQDETLGIANRAFSSCKGLTSITIPNSLTNIGEYAFSGCKGLTSITIPNSVTSIGEYAFYYCEGLKSIIVDSGNSRYDSRNNCNAIIETESNTLILGCKNTIIPSDITSIGNEAFRGCSGLTSIEIPNSVTSIGESAFRECFGLTSVTIGNSVTSIGDWAFYYCSGLTSIEIPGSVTWIGGYAFGYCKGLTNVTIPNSVTGIEVGAFYDCTELKEVHITDLDAWNNIYFQEWNGDYYSNPLNNPNAKLYLNGVVVEE